MGFYGFWTHTKNAKVRHRCSVCGVEIVVGEPIHKSTSREHPGAFVYTKKFCQECYEKETACSNPK